MDPDDASVSGLSTAEAVLLGVFALLLVMALGFAYVLNASQTNLVEEYNELPEDTKQKLQIQM